MNGVDELIQELSAVRGAVTADEAEELYRWRKSKDLEHLTNSAGWDVLLEMFKHYEENAIDALMAASPEDKESVLARHAVAYAVSRSFALLKNDVQQAIEAAQEIPTSLREGLELAKL